MWLNDLKDQSIEHRKNKNVCKPQIFQIKFNPNVKKNKNYIGAIKK